MSQDAHRPRHHFTAAKNWINDPNGVCFHGGRWHMFYQHNPNAAHWGDIHWGHASSTDLLHWRDEPLALAPSPGNDAAGCFSGSYALIGGTPTLFYTGDTGTRQVQCVATSPDLTHWTKHPERTLETPPAGVEVTDFRDPYVLRDGETWYMVVGASRDHARGQCLLYRSRDGVAWDYLGPLFTASDARLGVMWECPNLFRIGQHWVLTVSVWPGLGAHCFVGQFDGERFVPTWDAPLDVDAGSFAHLAMQAPDGRMLQWAWIREQREQALSDAAGWSGAMAVPRELGVDTLGRLTLRPVRELTQIRAGRLDVAATGATTGTLHRFEGRHLDIEARFHPGRHKVGLTLLTSPDGQESTSVTYWPDARRLSILRSGSSLDLHVSHQDVHGHLELDPGDALQLRVLLDASVLEVFANDRLCLTTRIYPSRNDSTLGTVFAEGPTAVELQGWVLGSSLASGRQPTLEAVA